MAKIKLDETTVFPDGLTYRDLRDSLAATAKTRMWHLAHEFLRRYKLQNVLCHCCGTVTTPHDRTFKMLVGLPICFCLKCGKENDR